MHVEAPGPQLPKRRVHVYGVAQDDGVDNGGFKRSSPAASWLRRSE
jgi:hypothetical protein